MLWTELGGTRMTLLISFTVAPHVHAFDPGLSGDASGVPTLPPLRTPHAVGEAAGQEPDPDPASNP